MKMSSNGWKGFNAKFTIVFSSPKRLDPNRLVH